MTLQDQDLIMNMLKNRTLLSKLPKNNIFGLCPAAGAPVGKICIFMLIEYTKASSRKYF